MICKYSELSSFRIPPKIKDNYKIVGGLSNVSEWKAKVITGNSGGSDKIGDWTPVGYVLISLDSDYIIPVSRGDEHHTGHDFLWELQNEGLVPKGKYVSIWSMHHDYFTTMDKIPAYQKWLDMGGENLIVQTADDLMNLNYVGRMQDVLEQKGQISVKKGKLNPLGRELVDSLETLALLYKKILSDFRNETAISQFEQSAKKLMKKLDSFLHNGAGIPYSFMDKNSKKVESFSDYKKIAEILFGMNGLKNVIHNQLRKLVAKLKKGKELDYSESKLVAYYGDLETALFEFNRLGDI